MALSAKAIARKTAASLYTQSLMFLSSRVEDNISRVAVVLHPSLTDIVNEPPSITRKALQRKLDVPISMAARKEGPDSGNSPTVDKNDESELYPISFGNEDGIILCLEREENVGEFAGDKILFGSSLVHNRALLGEDFANPL